MTTASTLPQTRQGLINKNTAVHKRKIPQLFYSQTTWKLSSDKELTEKEINEVIRRIGEFYARFLKEREKELISFGFELDFGREPLETLEVKGKDGSEFKLQVTLSSSHYIPTESFGPPSINLPLDQLSPETVNITNMAPKNKNSNGGPKKPAPTTVTPTLQGTIVKADDTAPTQNTGSGSTPTKG
jgi:hypothetical protein